jgi:hypothetical protein
VNQSSSDYYFRIEEDNSGCCMDNIKEENKIKEVYLFDGTQKKTATNSDTHSSRSEEKKHIRHHSVIIKLFHFCY